MRYPTALFIGFVKKAALPALVPLGKMLLGGLVSQGASTALGKMTGGTQRPAALKPLPTPANPMTGAGMM